MKYKLLSNGKGVILDRTAREITELELAFEGVPDGYTAVLKNCNGNELYRTLENGVCTVPNTFIAVGEISVVLTIIGDHKAKKWNCEGIEITRLCGKFLAHPADMDLPDRVVQAETAICEIKDLINEQNKKIEDLEKKMTKLFEGYDFI